jgi:hypothetical protein
LIEFNSNWLCDITPYEPPSARTTSSLWVLPDHTRLGSGTSLI